MCNDRADADYEVKKFKSNHECENYLEVCCDNENVIEIIGLWSEFRRKMLTTL